MEESHSEGSYAISIDEAVMEWILNSETDAYSVLDEAEKDENRDSMLHSNVVEGQELGNINNGEPSAANGALNEVYDDDLEEGELRSSLSEYSADLCSISSLENLNEQCSGVNGDVFEPILSSDDDYERHEVGSGGDECELSGVNNDSLSYSEPEMEIVDEWNESQQMEVVDEWNESQQIGGAVDFHPEEFYHLGEPVIQRVHRYGTQGEARQFHLCNLEHCPNLHERLGDIFDHALGRMLSETPGNAMAGAVYFYPSLDEPIYVHFRPARDLNGQMIVEQFERVLQSGKDLNIEDPDAIIRIVTVTPPVGCGYHNRHRYILHNDFLKRGHGGCFILIKNHDNLCLARAIVVAQAMLKKREDPHKWDNIRRSTGGDRSLQTFEARALMTKAGLQNHSGPCGIMELDMIQRALPQYKIKVFSKQVYGAIIFEGQVAAPQIIHLYHHDSHYTVISSMTAFFSRAYWCEDCNVAYNNKSDHRCINKCSSCYHSPPCREQRVILCSQCNRYFPNDKCFENHQRKYSQGDKDATSADGVSICDRIQRCQNCHRQFRRGLMMNHKCGYYKCRTCDEEVEEGHLCYMQNVDEETLIEDGACSDHDNDDDQPSTSRKSRRKELKEEIVQRFAFFDFETTQERVLRETELGSELQHIPNLCVAHVTCDNCRQRDYDSMCEQCGTKRNIFKGSDCLKEFCRFLFHPKAMHTTAIAHNAKGFDSHFILQYLYDEGVAPKVVTKGLQIICLSVGTIRIIDSFNFLPMALAALPKAFGIEESAKGFFPHLFNTAANWNYNGTWPEAFYYAPSSMKPEAYKNFTDWYKMQVGKTFNLQDELIKYCDSDVDILLKACMKFRDLFIAETTVDPFEKSLTIAGACNRVYRKLFLKPNTIGLIPHNGYRGKDKQSAKAISWMQWIGAKENIKIQHAGNGKEVRIGSYKVDGKCGNTVYEFHGCFWHGCLKCMPDRNKIIADGKLTAREAHQRTAEKKFYLQQTCGFRIIELWECELADMLEKEPEMRQYFQSMKNFEPMNPRDAFYGGRTNAIKLYHKVKKNERIDYVDVCSLYPYTNKYGKYPIGHPQVITDGFQSVTKDNKPYEGLIKCLIQPPENLYHPLLPIRVDGKLLFPLCGTCAREKHTGSCNHNSHQRALIGTWVTCELYKALDLGYVILEIYEVWHYEKTAKLNPDSGDDGLFGGYINSFMKSKMEAEGWPEKCNDAQSKITYCNEVLKQEGIELDPLKISRNPGRRALAKLMLNSFWGKFWQRNNMIKTMYFTDPKEYFQVVFDSSNLVHSITIISENLVAVTYSQKDDFTDVLPYTNPVIAAYTTSQARLTLYSYIEKLGRRVLYFDTDSLIYVSDTLNHRQYRVPIGWSLGEMTDELKSYGPGSYISEFVSGGPKNYAFKVFSPRDKGYHYSVKVRGITLSKMISKRINFKSLRSMVKDFVRRNQQTEIGVVFNQIGRRREGGQVVTRTMSKRFRVVYDKRIALKNFYTVPYGWIF